MMEYSPSHGSACRTWTRRITIILLFITYTVFRRNFQPYVLPSSPPAPPPPPPYFPFRDKPTAPCMFSAPHPPPRLNGACLCCSSVPGMCLPACHARGACCVCGSSCWAKPSQRVSGPWSFSTRYCALPCRLCCPLSWGNRCCYRLLKRKPGGLGGGGGGGVAMKVFYFLKTGRGILA